MNSKGIAMEENPSSKKEKGGGLWHVLEMAKKHNRLAVRGSSSLRCRFNSLMAVIIITFVVVFSFTSMKNGDGRGGFWHDAAAAVFPTEAGECDLFAGNWVFDNTTGPLYSERCKFMSDQSACEKFGRQNLRYQNWRWKPHGCDIPSFNATKLLERLRGKRLAFVGDSLNRNQWISMICLLDSVIPDHMKSMQANGSLTSFKAKEYNASIEFYWAPLLVESNSDDPVHHRIPDRIIRAQSIEKHAKHWMGADILVFNSYLWWRRVTMKVLWGSFDDKDAFYKDIEILRSYEMALRTWAEWLEFHVDHIKTKLFFMSMSPTHFWGDEWGINSSQNCYNETEPIRREDYWGRGSDKRMMRVVESTIFGLKERGVKVQIINITQLSEYRKDGHPSTYRKQWEPLTKEQLANPSSYADCIHWCLPGVPDVWNQLLYTYILFK
ncbi:protein trichome birefringence-like 34 [Phalaenopsis equestris]|uniref:protein trichome birefringence-like 34 n=1 Tax=Phalaenopsis equestris TaxID=78828 RepID=UPI0009E44739|nr:protein trichome birefringence-like 34 [Phalaenopsis equestris]